MRRLLAQAVVLAVVFSESVIVPHSADAAVPGAVGKIVFWSDRDTAQGWLDARKFAGGTWRRLTWNAAYERQSA